ncbi:MAG: carboxypeptidase-like regulatory domain-containing protein [Flavobacteriales bacterium]
MHKFGSKILIQLALILLPLSLNAQGVKGFVYEKSSGEPVIFANVVVKESGMGTTTDLNGYFSMPQVEQGTYTLEISFVGYAKLSKSVTVENKPLNLKFFLEETNNVLGPVILDAKKADKKTQSNVSKINITPTDINRLPSIGGQADLAQYIQVLPGVVFTGDQGGQLYVRGGTPVQNLVLLDGMTIYSPFHSIGFTSVFDTDLIKSADVYTAAFGAEYGGRMSSVMDIKTKDGNKKNITGKLSANTFGAKLTLSGPLSKPSAGEFSKSTFVLSAKQSYIDKLADKIYPSAVQSGESTIPFSYSDVFGKLSFGSESGSKINLFGFSFNDKVNYDSKTSFDWRSTGGGANAIMVIPNSLSIIEMDFTYSDYEMNEIGKELREGELTNLDPKTSRINEFRFNFNVKRNISENKSFKLGVNIGGGSTEFSYKKANLIDINLTDNTNFLAAYYKLKFTHALYVIEPSIRLTSYTSAQSTVLEPRLSAKYNLTENTRLKTSGGLYSQNLVAANSGRQVVNLFNGFTSTPSNLPDGLLGEDIDSEIQKAWHAVLGAEFDINKNLELNTEAYFKQNYQLISINSEQIGSNASQVGGQPAWRLSDFVYEKGYSYGADLTLKYNKDRFSLNSTYSFSWTELESDAYGKYHPIYDRRHNLNMTSSYEFLEDKSLILDLRFNYGTGFPFAQIIGNYEGVNIDGVGGSYVDQNGDLISFYDAPDSGRLPVYARLDASLTKSYKLKNKQALELNFTITNLTNRKNIFYYDKLNQERINQLPFLPSLGVNWSF